MFGRGPVGKKEEEPKKEEEISPTPMSKMLSNLTQKVLENELLEIHNPFTLPYRLAILSGKTKKAPTTFYEAFSKFV